MVVEDMKSRSGATFIMLSEDRFLISEENHTLIPEKDHENGISRE